MACNSSNSNHASGESAENMQITDKIADETTIPKSMTCQEYKSWMYDTSNGYHVIRSIINYTYSLQYRTSDLVACLENESLTEENYILYSSMFTHAVQFVVKVKSIRSSDANLNDTLYKTVNLACFKSGQQAFKLVQHGKIINCNLFHFEPARSQDDPFVFNVSFEDSNIVPEEQFELVFSGTPLGFEDLRHSFNFISSRTPTVSVKK